jgi:hypothetical protein
MPGEDSTRPKVASPLSAALRLNVATLAITFADAGATRPSPTPRPRPALPPESASRCRSE